MRAGGAVGGQPGQPHLLASKASAHLHARMNTNTQCVLQKEGLAEGRKEGGKEGDSLSYEIVGAAGTQHVEGDAGLRVKVQPPLVLLFGEDQVERVPGAPLLRRLHQILELHPPVLRYLPPPPLASGAFGLDLTGRRGGDAQGRGGEERVWRKQTAAVRTAAAAAAASAAATTSSTCAWPGIVENAAGARSLYRCLRCSSVLSKPHSSPLLASLLLSSSSSPRYEISPGRIHAYAGGRWEKNAMTKRGAGQPSMSLRDAA